jgi:hypothetical protein
LFVAVQEAFLTETASGPTWFCRPLRGPIGRVPAPTPTGPAIFKGAHVQPSHEEPNQECPLLFTTGRIVNHFYSRATTDRAQQETGAAPASGRSRRRPTRLDATACITGIPPGVFGPFLYGYRGQPEGDGPRRAARAANQLTITESDPVSKQPL